MKTKFILLLAAALLFASCSDKIGIMKRRYNKGFYIAHRSNVSSPKQHESKPAESEVAPEVLTVKELKESVETVQVGQEASAPIKNKIQFSVPAVRKNHTENPPLASASPNFKEKKDLKLMNSESTVLLKQRKASNSKLIIEIILAIFPVLCLIAVFLHDGKNITLNFWIDLLLHLTLIGEIIFAILVVLDIVDLK